MLLPTVKPQFWTSLGLSMFFSFLAPIVLFCGVWGILLTVAQIPWTQQFGHLATAGVCQFLAIFGTGSPWLGLMVISGVAAIVGALFDAYAFSLSRSYPHEWT